MGKGRRAVEIAVILLTVVFLGYQFFASYYFAITTESAYFYEYSEGVELVGTVIRNEHIVTASHSGTLHFLIADGERVAKGGTIAQVYTDDKASAAVTRIDEIEEQLSSIEEIEGYNDLNAVDMSTINAKISENLNSFIYSVSDNTFDGASAASVELLTAMTHKQVATGEKTDFSAVKQELNDEKEELSSYTGTPRSVYTADYSGYFVSSVDGYEALLGTEDLSIYTPEYMNSLKAEDMSGTAIGKIVHDYEWYVAATIPLGDSMYYKTGDSVKLRVEAADQTVSAVIERINFSNDSDTAVIILSCNEMNSRLASMRSGKMTIVKKEYSGLRINSKAIRIVDGVTGVYVVSGLEVKFVSAEILYSNDEYAICSLNTADESQLRLYDEVVVKGKGLYDGKIIY